MRLDYPLACSACLQDDDTICKDCCFRPTAAEGEEFAEIAATRAMQRRREHERAVRQSDDYQGPGSEEEEE